MTEMHILLQRLIFSILALAIIGFAIFEQSFGRVLTLVVVEVIVFFALLELITLMRASDLSMPYLPVFALGLLMPVLFFAEEGRLLQIGVTMVLFCCGPVLVAAGMFGGIRRLMERIAISAFAFLYIVVPLSIAMYLRESETPASLLFLVVVATVCTDTGAFIFGSLFGRHKLAPGLSPNKTWEGAIGGALAALLVVAVLGTLMTGVTQQVGEPSPDEEWFFLIRGWGAWRVMLATLLFSIVGQVGDLAESMFKREAGVKDSGGGLMGHGGVLDRMDSHLFNLPLAAALKLIFG